MARDKSELKSGMGKAMRSFSALIEEVEDLGGGDDHVRKLETDAVIRRTIAKLLIGETTNGLGDAYMVTVDRDKKLKAMIEAGRYDYANSDITDKHFPVEGSGQSQVEIILRHYDKVMSKDAVLADLDKDGLRPATIEELLALGADTKTRDLQRKFPIIAFGSVWRGLFGYRYVAFLDGNGSERYLSLSWFGFDFYEFCRFAAVRK